MNANPEFAKFALDEASRSKNHVRRAAWLTLVLALLLLLILTVAVADYRWLLPWEARAAGFLLMAAVLTAGIARLAYLLRRPASLKEAALDVESRNPKLGCTISTAAEYLGEKHQITQEYEPELVAALETQAAVLLTREQVPYYEKLLLPGLLLGVALVVLIAFLAGASDPLTALRRTTLPWASRPYTTVEVKPGNAEIPVGRDLNIESVFHGREPKEVRLHWRGEQDASWHSTVLTKAGDSNYAHTFQELRQTTDYRLTGGDAVSPDFRILTYIPPDVKDLRIRLEYPGYTGRKAIVQNLPNISIVRGSAATFQIMPTVKLSKARLRGDKMPEVELKPGADGGWTGGFTLAQDSDYWIELRDERGRLGVNEKPYHIKALPDAPPKVEIVEPGQDMRADATNTIALKISVSDDFGVGDIKLIYHKLGGPERVAPVRIQNQRSNEVTATAELALAPIGLKDYELVAYHVEASDKNTLDGPGVGKSPVYFVEITDEEGQRMRGQGQNTTVNLLVIQKQIIADTQATAKDAAQEKFTELAAREKDAVDFGQLYQNSLASNGAPAEAVSLMTSAVQDLREATAALETRQRDKALPPEESALARFYQVVKLIPALTNMPTQQTQTNTNGNQQSPEQNPMVRVVLEAIKQQKKPQTDNQELAELMNQIQQLSRSQMALNQSGRNQSSQNGRNQSTQNAPNQSSQNQSGQGQIGQGQNGQGQNGQGQNGQGQNGQQPGGAAGQGDRGDRQAEANENNESSNHAENQDRQPGSANNEDASLMEQLAKLAKSPEMARLMESLAKEGASMAEKLGALAGLQEELNKEGAEMAEKLERLSGKDARLGHNLRKTMNQAMEGMTSAAQGWKSGDRPGAVARGTQAARGLNTVASMLEKILEAERQLSDVSHEEYPAEYETAIRDYLKRLSYQD